MWFMHPQGGFYSAVEHRDDPNRMLVRGRDRTDMETLVEIVNGLPHGPGYKPPVIIENSSADYLYRIELFRSELEDVMTHLVGLISYANFKDEVKRVQGGKRADLYSRVWSVLADLQPTRPYEGLRWTDYRDDDLDATFWPPEDLDYTPAQKRRNTRLARLFPSR